MAVVGVVRWVLHLPGCSSLKAKRAVIRSLKDRLHTRHRVSVAETAYQDRWQKAELWAAFVAGDRRLADSLISRLDQLVASEPRAHVIERETIFY